MAVEKFKVVRPDAKGRITLGAFAKDVSSFHVTREKDTGRLILDPYAEIPLEEQWLWKDKEAMESVRRGLADAKAGRTVSLGSFVQYIDDENE